MTRLGLSKRSQAGSSIMEILFSIAILGVGGMIFTQYTQRIKANRMAGELMRHRTLITTMLSTSTDCQKTAGCVDGELRELRDSEGRILVNALGTSTYGPWQVQAKCQADQTIEVRVSSSANGKPRKNLLNNEVLDLDNKNGILFAPAMLCGKLTNKTTPGEILTINSPRCKSETGGCWLWAGLPMCCEDGRDIPKPMCPSGSSELSAHWDRDGDWGMNGLWVVLCG